MAQDDDLVLIPGTGAIWTGTVGTATKPTLTQLNTFAAAGTMPSGWTNLGHTSLEDLPAPGRDGGDVTTLGSWQSASLRSRQDAVTRFIDVKSLQILDNAVLELYYGGGDFTDPNEFILPVSSSPVEKAVTVVINDGGTVLALYEPKMSIIGVDEFELDPEDFATVPLRFTHLDGATAARWIGADLGTPA